MDPHLKDILGFVPSTLKPLYIGRHPRIHQWIRQGVLVVCVGKVFVFNPNSHRTHAACLFMYILKISPATQTVHQIAMC